MPTSPRRLGFTLIELLVVISIIALLIGILLPALSSARGVARSAKCLANQRQLAIAQTIYTTQNKSYLAPAIRPDPNWPPAQWWQNRGLMELIPGQTSESASNSDFQKADNLGGILVCPLDTEVVERYALTDEQYVSYGQNVETGVSDDWYGASLDWRKIDEFPRASEMMIYMDWAEGSGTQLSSASSVFMAAYNDYHYNPATTPPYVGVLDNMLHVTWHPTLTLNTSYADGHASNIQYKPADASTGYWLPDSFSGDGSPFWHGGARTNVGETTLTY